MSDLTGTQMEVIHGMEAGDLLLVRTSSDLGSSEILQIRDAVHKVVRNLEDVRVLIVPDEYMGDVKKMSVEEMFSLRRALDEAIQSKASTGMA